MAILCRGGRCAGVFAQPDTHAIRRGGHPGLYLQSAGAAALRLENPAHTGSVAGDERVVAAVRLVAVDCVTAAGKGNQPVCDASAGLDRVGACSIDAEVAAVVWRGFAMG